MKLIKTYKEAAAILHQHQERDLREIAENKDAIIELIEDKHIYTNDGTDTFVAQLAGPEGEDLYAYELVDWYLMCDTDSCLMSSTDKDLFLDLGGEIRS